MEEGTLLTRLNNYGIEVMTLESERLKEGVCHAKQDSMLQEPFTMLSSAGSKSAGLSMMTRTDRTSANDWGILPKRRKPGFMPGH